MKKTLILFACLALVTGLMISCSDSGGDDVEKALQGTWLDNPTTFDNTVKAYLIMTDSTFEMDVYLAGDAAIPANLQDGSSKGDLVADNGTFTTTTKYSYDAGTTTWVPETPPSVDTSTYVKNSSTSITITADWDGNAGTPPTAETFIKQ